MSLSCVYGLKFQYEDLKELLKLKFYPEVDDKWKKYLLGYLVGRLNFHLQQSSKIKVGVFCTGFQGYPGDECVLGIEVSIQELENPSDIFGWRIYRAIGTQIGKQKGAYDKVIQRMEEIMGILRGHPRLYHVENCGC